jgi:hypothetical protein
MDDKDINNIHAWRMLQKGRASPEDQKLAFKIHSDLLTHEQRKRWSITTGRNLLLDILIHREKILKTKAYAIVADVENVHEDSIRKPYLDWEKQTPKSRTTERDLYYKNRSSFINQAESDARTARIQNAVKAHMQG